MREGQENFSNLSQENELEIVSSFEELKRQVEKEVPDYEKFIPKNELVEEIPSIEKRQKGVRYFNDEKLMERVMRIDLKRILGGERSITATPVNKITFERELDVLKKKAKFKAEIYSLGENISYEEAYEKAKEEEVKEYQQRTKKRGGGYDIKADEIKTYDKFKVENLKDKDEAVFPHEDMHAFFAQNCKYLQEIAINERELENLINEELLVILEEKQIENDLDEKNNGATGSFTNKEWEEMFKNKTNEDEITDILMKKKELREKIKILHEKVKIRPDILALDEGFAFAITNKYANWNPDNFDGYRDKTDPDLIKKARDLSEKIISSTGIEFSKKIILEVINEVYDKKNNAIELFEEKVLNYIGKSN